MTYDGRLRLGYVAGFLVCAALMSFALYLQYVKGEDPCPLCMVQRIAFTVLGAIFLVAAMHGPGRTGALIYAVVLFLIAGAGAAVAARHVWLQSLPKHMVPECGPGLDYILERFPLGRALELILRGAGECAEKVLTCLVLTIAVWALLWFIALALLAIALAWAKRAR